MENSILISIKKLLGISANDTSFDEDIIVHTNTAIATLTQLGIANATGFEIIDASAVWSDLIGPNLTYMNSIKTYIYIKVKLVFDPPTSGSLMDSLTSIGKELEWRIQMAYETNA